MMDLDQMVADVHKVLVLVGADRAFDELASAIAFSTAAPARLRPLTVNSRIYRLYRLWLWHSHCLFRFVGVDHLAYGLSELQRGHFGGRLDQVVAPNVVHQILSLVAVLDRMLLNQVIAHVDHTRRANGTSEMQLSPVDCLQNETVVDLQFGAWLWTFVVVVVVLLGLYFLPKIVLVVDETLEVVQQVVIIELFVHFVVALAAALIQIGAQLAAQHVHRTWRRSLLSAHLFEEVLDDEEDHLVARLVAFMLLEDETEQFGQIRVEDVVERGRHSAHRLF